MRLLVFFDLPVVSKEDRRIYQRFRKFLLADGYDMLQFSVYSRIVNGEDGVDKHLKRLGKNIPGKGGKHGETEPPARSVRATGAHIKSHPARRHGAGNGELL